MISQPAQQISGIYHRKIGDIVVTAVSDGYFDGSLDVMGNVDLDAAHRLMRDAFRPARRTSVNAFLIYSKGRLAIVDNGSGNCLVQSKNRNHRRTGGLSGDRVASRAVPRYAP
jgi:hypothetical protein